MGWLRQLFTRRRRYDELSETIREHLDEKIADLMDRGMTREQAESAARREFGNVTRIEERSREVWQWPTLESVWADMKYALRQLRKAPGFTATVILILALGIGANTAVFSLLCAVMLRSLPVAHPEQLYRVGASFDCCVLGGLQDDWSIYSYPLYVYLRDNTHAFEQLAAFETNEPTFNVRRDLTGASSESLLGEFVSGNYFDTFGLHPAAGNLLHPSDDTPQATPVAILSYQAWKLHYGLDPRMVGGQVTITGHPFTIIGIAPAAFYGDRLRGDPPDLYIPLNQEPVLEGPNSVLHIPYQHWLYALGRLKPGITPEQVSAQMTLELRHWLPINGNLSSQDMAKISRQQIRLTPGGAGITGMLHQFKSGLYLLISAAGLVLLIACANLANLLLARGSVRRQQIAVQLAMGATRRRLMRSMLTETLLLSLAGGGAGVGLAYLGAKAILLLVFLGATYVPIHAAPSWQVLCFALLLSLVTCALFGIIPAWIISRADPAHVLAGANRSTGNTSSLPQKSLIVFQAAFSLVLLVLAGLVTDHLSHLVDQKFGFQMQGRLFVSVDPLAADYKPGQLNMLYQQIENRLSQLPGVLSVSFSTYSPQAGENWGSYIGIEGRPSTATAAQNANWLRVGPHYFATIGVQILRGRSIGDQDTASSEHVAVVDETFANHFFPHQNPIGKHFGFLEAGRAGDYTVVGVVKAAKYLRSSDSIGQEDPRFFLPLSQNESFTDPSLQRLEVESHYIGSIEIHVAGDPAQFGFTVRRTLASIAPDLTILSMSSFRDQVEGQFNEQRLISNLSGLFGLLALLLASVGLYGVTAYSVAQRSPEIGIRLALGSNRRRIVLMVLKAAFQQIGIGLLLGLPLALLASHVLASEMYGLPQFDLAALLTALLLLLLSTLVAAVLPARRAASVDPMQTLRAE